MKKRFPVIFFLSALLVACAHVSEMREGIEALEGKDISEATNILGQPSEIKEGKSFDVYIWDYQYEATAPQGVRTTSAAATPDPDQVPSNASHSTRSCFIKFDVDKKKIIRGWYYKGDQQGCGVAHTKWIQKLKEYAIAHPKQSKLPQNSPPANN